MYILLLLMLAIPGLLLVAMGVKRRRPLLIAGGCTALAAVVCFFWLLDFWGEMLWFDALGFHRRFWTEILASAAFSGSGALLGFIVVALLAGRKQGRPLPTLVAALFGAWLGGRWGLAHWQPLLLYANRVETTMREPVLELSTGFYLFTLPMLDAVFGLLLQIAIVGMLAAIALNSFSLSAGDAWRRNLQIKAVADAGSTRRLSAAGAVMLLVLAAGAWLQRYHLLFSTWGVVSGPGWTDVHIRLPAYAVLAVFLFLGACWLAAAAFGILRPDFSRLPVAPPFKSFSLLALPVLVVGVVWLLGLSIIPGLFQWLFVEPNEITYEQQYIANNILFTRQGFGLDHVEVREFPAGGAFDQQTADSNRQLLKNIRLWDRRALDAVYKQFQEIRLYYEFVGVDIDRYTVDGNYRQVMVSAREMQQGNLPLQSQTFVNRRFKYTHGYGITMTPVSEFTPEGLPNLLIKDIPPKSASPDLAIHQPQIYYGELTDQHVIANSSEAEFDYPRGEDNVYNHYSGKGGVEMGSLWRKFLFGWKFDGTPLLLSSYPRPGSRILFHRQVHERVAEVAPFLHFDDDPYIVLEGGRLYWIIDGYTSSSLYPYAERFYSHERIEYRNGGGDQLLSSRVGDYLNGINYIRNSVKAVVDAFDGTVALYIFDPEDPLIRAWQRTFPTLFKERGEMPAGLAAHVRYPTDMLLVQGLVYTKYHMTDPRVFYNQEDLWVRATEKYYSRVVPVSPYYVMWEMPGSDQLEFVLILPFTPKNRQVMIGWIAGMCDAGNYGRFLVFKFPKEKRVLGPQQVETKIDQDRFLAGQLTLWDQRGSKVIRGNVLAIPIEETILYVEPIYLQAETAAYPELRLVVLMHNDQLVYAPTFGEALQKLLGLAPEEKGTTLPAGPTLEELLQKARDALNDYLRQTGEGNFKAAAQAMSTLKETLEELGRMKAGPS
jgi:uncharacterized membrane protein (UPF0182 family)